jgi:hypothetical protein
MAFRNDKWLVRVIYALSSLTLALIVLLALFSVQTKSEISDIKKSIFELQQKLQHKEAPKAIKGEDGRTPVLNKDYFVKDGKTPECYFEPQQCRGQDSVSTHTEKTILQEVPIAGKNGLMQETIVDESCLLMTRYQGDTSWQILAQLPKPCEVL